MRVQSLQLNWLLTTSQLANRKQLVIWKCVPNLYTKKMCQIVPWTLIKVSHSQYMLIDKRLNSVSWPWFCQKFNLTCFSTCEKEMFNKWMDGWVRVLRPFNSISAISRRWKGEHERLCAMKRRLGSRGISPPAGFEPATLLFNKWD